MPLTTPGLTSSKTGTFYFAYGSNLSPTQMTIRLPHDTKSGEPVALARLDHHKWIICEKGDANIVSLPPSEKTTDANSVWGIVYNLSPENEAVLDLYEGHDERHNPRPQKNQDPETKHIRPYEQGGWLYNKHYLPVTVTKWFQNPKNYGVDMSDYSETSKLPPIAILVYVNEHCTQPGQAKPEYIGRMNRAIAQSKALGLPIEWVDTVMRKYIPPGILLDDENYVGHTDHEKYAESNLLAAKRFAEQNKSF